MDGEEGYLKSEFVNVMSLDDSNSYNLAQSSPAPVYTATPAPTAEPTPAPTAEPTPVITPEPTAEPTEKPTPEPVELDEIQILTVTLDLFYQCLKSLLGVLILRECLTITLQFLGIICYDINHIELEVLFVDQQILML